MSEALWTHRISRHGATKVTPFELVYGQEAVLPIEVNLDAYRLSKQNDLSVVMHHDLMMDNIYEVTDVRLKALMEMEKDKARVAKAYYKKIKSKSFQVDRRAISLPSGHQIERVLTKRSKSYSEILIC